MPCLAPSLQHHIITRMTSASALCSPAGSRRPWGTVSSRSASLARLGRVGSRARPQQLQRAYQSQASHALQQQQEQRGPSTSGAPRQQQQQQPEGEHHINPDEWDLSYW